MTTEKRVFVGKHYNFHYEIILCPKCSSKQIAKVIHRPAGIIRQHECNDCKTQIHDSDWIESLLKNEAIDTSLKVHGIQAQIEKYIEKSLHLTTLLYQSRKANNHKDLNEVIKSIGDLYVMLDHLKIIFGEKSIEHQITINYSKLQSALNPKIKDENIKS